MPQALPQSAGSLLVPRIDDVVPAAALPGSEVELTGANLGPLDSALPAVLVDGQPAHVLMCRSSRLALRVPEPAGTSMIEVRNLAGVSNAAPLRVARLLSDGLHPVTSPAVSRSGMIYATISGQRGKQTPVSVVRISPDGRGTPFVTEILNATGLAFNPDGDLFVTSRAEGNVYRIDEVGEPALYAEGMGVATGAAFDAEGNLFVGDRSGTIFKINTERQIFVHATLEPSPAAYHPRVVSRPGTSAGPGAGQQRRCLPCHLPAWPAWRGARHSEGRGNAGTLGRKYRRAGIFAARYRDSGHQRRCF